MKTKKIKTICSILALICIMPIVILFAVWGIDEVLYPEITFDDYNGRSYCDLGASGIFTFTADKKIGHAKNGCDVYTVKYDDNNDFLYCTGYRMHYIMTALDYSYEDMKAIAHNGNVTQYKVIKEFERSYFYDNSQAFIDALKTLDNNPDLLEAAGDYTKEDFGGPMYLIELCYDDMPVSLHTDKGVKGIEIDTENNQAYYLPERYKAGDDKTIYKVLDTQINQLLIDTINSHEFEK